jgi:hypothetical protein
LGREPTAAELSKATAFIRQYETQAAEANPDSPWRYGSGKLNPANGKIESFRHFEYALDERLQHGPSLPAADGGHASLTANGGSPGDNLDQAVIRRWVSPLNGTISITGRINHVMSEQAHRFSYSNGIRASIISSRQGTLATWTLAGLAASTGLEDLRVEKGETIDFVVDPRGDYESDDFTWAPTLEESLSAKQKEAGQKPLRWSAAEDFQLPQTKPLTAWEQYAQVLTMTNEFTFID